MGRIVGVDRRQPEARVARVVQRERVVLGDRGVQQRAQLLLVLGRGDDQVGQLALCRQREHPLVAGPVLADQPAAVDRDEHRLVVLADVVHGLVEGPLEERRVQGDDRSHAAHRQPGRERHRVLLGDADVEHPVRVLGLEAGHPGAGRHAGGDPDDPPVGPGQLDQLGGEDRGVVRVLLRLGDDHRRRRVVAHRFGRHEPGCAVVGVGRGGHRDRRQRRAVEPDLVGLGRAEAATLLGPDVDDGRTGQRERPPERLEQRVHVVPGDDADVGDPEVLEELSRLGEADDGRPQPPAPLEQGGPDHRNPLDRPVIRALALLPGVRELDLAQVLRERADGRADRHLVVVDDDEHLGLALADVVERLERQAAHQSRVADDDRDPLQAVAQVARLGQTLGDGQAGSGVTAIEHVVRRLRASREAADAIDLAQRPEPLQASGQELVRVRLMSGVPDDLVARRFEEPVQGDGQLDDTQRRAEVAAGRGDGPDDRVADLGRELGQLRFVEPAQVGGVLDGREDRHGGLDSWCTGVDHRSAAGVGRADERRHPPVTGV